MGTLNRGFNSFEDRFWSKVSRRGDSECWEWQGALDHNGYGAISIRGKVKKAHRLAFSLSCGIDPGEQEVRHKCDNRKCVNPSHLELGSHQDNMNDLKERKRYNVPALKMQDNPAAKLRNSDIPVIREKHKCGRSMTSIGREYGVSKTAIAYIIAGKTWANA